MAEKYQIVLSVSKEQEYAILQLYIEKKWSYVNLCKYITEICREREREGERVLVINEYVHFLASC